MSAELQSFLKGLPAFERFSDRHIDALAERLQVADHPAGHVFMSQGEDSIAVQLVLGGKVEIVRHNPLTGEDEELGESGPGELCCVLALIENMPAAVTVRAMGVVRSAALSQAHYNELALLAQPICQQLQYMLAVQLARDIQRLNSGLRDYVESFGDPTTILPGKGWRATS